MGSTHRHIERYSHPGLMINGCAARIHVAAYTNIHANCPPTHAVCVEMHSRKYSYTPTGTVSHRLSRSTLLGKASDCDATLIKQRGILTHTRHVCCYGFHFLLPVVRQRKVAKAC